MAFNPFHSFRRHQKKFFAALTIMCMFIFVLSSGMGRGDWFTQWGEYFGGRGSTAQAAASLYGRDIDQATLATVQRRRLIANRYIEMAINYSHQDIKNRVFERFDRLDPSFKQLVQEYISPPQYVRQLGDFGVINNWRILASRVEGLQQQFASSTEQKSDQASNKEQATLAADFAHFLRQSSDVILEKGRSPRDGYFGGRVDSPEDTLDFLIWKHKADELGINYTPQDVAEAVTRETLSHLTPEATTQIHNHLNSEYRGMYNPEMLTDALGQEFRVRAARNAIMGEAGSSSRMFQTRSEMPTLTTPDEFFEWFKDNRTLVRVGLIELPVEQFTAKVPDPTDENALKELYAKHKNDEPNPARETPGFKEPSKVKIEWFAVPRESAFHRKVAAAVLAADPLGLAARLLEQYDYYSNYSPNWTNPNGYGMGRAGLHDSSVLRAENFAALAGACTSGNPLAGPLAMEASAFVQESKDRARIGATTILSGASENLLGIDALPMAVTPAPLTLEQLRPILLIRILDDSASKLLKKDIETFETELAKRGKEADGKTVEAYVAEFTSARQFQRGGMTDLRDRFHLADDPGLAQVRAAFKQIASWKRVDDPVGDQFAMELMENLQEPGAKPANFQASELGAFDVSYIFWRNEDREPKVVPFEQCRPQVVAAWKLAKARDLAKSEAEKLAAEARGMDVQKLRDLAVRTSPKPFMELNAMGRLNAKISPMAGPSQYGRPTVPRDKVTYPGDMAAQLVDLRTQENGATKVISDLPKANYFVASLLGKDVPTVEEFRTVYRNSMAPSQMLRDPLLSMFLSERQANYAKGVLQQLRDEAKLVINKSDKKQPAQDRDRDMSDESGE
ncbi:MAG: hypothetical protein ACJ8C4_10485 [Gemmataceae bacterium]